HEKTSHSLVFAPDCCVPEFLRKRAGVHDDYDNDPRDDRAAYYDDAKHDDPLLIGSFLPATRKGHATACPYFFWVFSGFSGVGASAVWASSSAWLTTGAIAFNFS